MGAAAHRNDDIENVNMQGVTYIFNFDMLRGAGSGPLVSGFLCVCGEGEELWEIQWNIGQAQYVMHCNLVWGWCWMT